MTAILLHRAYYLQDLQHLLKQIFYEKGRLHFSAKTHTHHVHSSTDCTGNFVPQILQMREIILRETEATPILHLVMSS